MLTNHSRSFDFYDYHVPPGLGRGNVKCSLYDLPSTVETRFELRRGGMKK